MQSFPFTSQVTYDESGNPEYDRAVDSDILRNVLKNYYTNGVFPNPSTNFQVVADEGMQVVIRPGACIIEGATAYETESRTLVVQAAEYTDRIDTVVLRLNDNIDYRNIDLYVVKGTSSSEAPALTRTGGVYEIGLANLYISSNSTTITTERITDTRLDAERCGYSMPIQQIDTTALYDQLQAQVDANIDLIQRAIDGTESQHLQSQIDVLSSDMMKANSAIEKHTQDISELNESMVTKPNWTTFKTKYVTNYTSQDDEYVAVFARSVDGSYVEVKIDNSLVWSGQLFSNSQYGSVTPYFYIPKGSTIGYTTSGTIYDAHINIVSTI